MREYNLKISISCELTDDEWKEVMEFMIDHGHSYLTILGKRKNKEDMIDVKKTDLRTARAVHMEIVNLYTSGGDHEKIKELVKEIATLPEVTPQYWNDINHIIRRIREDEQVLHRKAKQQAEDKT